MSVANNATSYGNRSARRHATSGTVEYSVGMGNTNAVAIESAAYNVAYICEAGLPARTCA